MSSFSGLVAQAKIAALPAWPPRFIIIPITCLFFNLFILNVDAAQVTLAWDAPTAADGTPLTDLGGYRVYMGTEADKYTEAFDTGITTTYKVDNLSAGNTYYFAVTAIDNDGNESNYSNEFNKNIPVPPQFVLSVSKNGSGTGAVTGAGISCGTNCSASFAQGTAVMLTAAPDSGSSFAGWSGGGCTGAGPCNITVNAATTVTATFNAVYTIMAVTNLNGTLTALNNSNVIYAANSSISAAIVFVTGGANQMFSISPNAGYHVAAVTVDGRPIGAVNSYTFSNVTAGHTIEATFAIN